MSPEVILRMRSSFVALTASLRSNHEMAFGSGFGMILLETSHAQVAASVEGDTTEHQGSVVRYDPALEPIEARVVREWKEEDALRYILYSIGHFKESLPSWRASWVSLRTKRPSSCDAACMGGPTSLSSDRQAVCETRLRSLVRQLEVASWKAPKQKIPTPTGEPSTQLKTMSQGIPTSYPTRRVSIPFLGTKQQLVLADRRMPAWHHLSPGARSGCKQHRRVRSFDGRTPDRSGGRDRSTRQSRLPSVGGSGFAD